MTLGSGSVFAPGTESWRQADLLCGEQNSGKQAGEERHMSILS